MFLLAAAEPGLRDGQRVEQVVEKLNAALMVLSCHALQTVPKLGRDDEGKHRFLTQVGKETVVDDCLKVNIGTQ